MNDNSKMSTSQVGLKGTVRLSVYDHRDALRVGVGRPTATQNCHRQHSIVC